MIRPRFHRMVSRGEISGAFKVILRGGWDIFCLGNGEKKQEDSLGMVENIFHQAEFGGSFWRKIYQLLIRPWSIRVWIHIELSTILMCFDGYKAVCTTEWGVPHF